MSNLGQINSIMLDFAKRRHICCIHFVGIGGAGMSGIAEVLLNLGFAITGSDIAENKSIKHLRTLGAKIYIGHAAQNISACQVMVQSTAIDNDNIEIRQALINKIVVIPRAEMLAELMRFNKGIAVCGTHGKTTTTSLIASIFAEADFDPTFIIGGLLNSAGSNARLGKGKYLIAEADESDASFLHLQPLISVVTNIEADHMDTYAGNFDQLKQTFIDFVHNLPFYGLVVCCIDDKVIHEIRDEFHRPIVSYGFSEKADYQVQNFKQTRLKSEFRICLPNGGLSDKIVLNMPGKHNVLNAVAAAAVALEEGIAMSGVQQALEKFEGIARRFQTYQNLVINHHKITLVDDYGHHPSEVRVTLQAVKAAYPHRRIVLLFQPHRYSRTRDLYEDFVQVLSTADVLLLLDVYAAGEEEIPGADSKSLCRSIRQRGRLEPIYIEHENAINTILKTQLNDNDVLVMQGAGSVGLLVQKVISEAQEAMDENA